ncbi:MAG: hypothetical protein U9Q03_02205 [Patescibacteria group bacterium]|nr:hypothetical protein [Patescibacteria group bacterium]
MSFSLGLLLIPYFIAVGGFLLFAALNVYHLITYGATTRTSFLFTFGFLAGSVLIAYASWWFLHDIDWAREITFQLMQTGAIEQF